MVCLQKVDADSTTFMLERLDDTRILGGEIARVLIPGMVILLEGELGAGKTTLVREICGSLGWHRTCSPSFSLVNEYAQAKIPVAHADLYRLDCVDGRDFGFDDYLDEGWILLVEWPERLISADFAELWRCRIDCVGDKRLISICAEGEEAIESLRRLTKFFS